MDESIAEKPISTPTELPSREWPDERKIEDMNFEGGERIRDLLRLCGVTLAHDIFSLGCTGARVAGLSFEEIKELRLGLAGGGVGLPCFVPPDRFCFAHNVEGGLQRGQKQMYPGSVVDISRPLAKEEIAHAKLIEAARRSDRERDAADLLEGRELPKGWTPQDDHEHDVGGEVHSWSEIETKMGTERVARVQAQVDARIGTWKCPEHGKTNWKCRYCVAQAVVEGDLMPEIAVVTKDEEGLIYTTFNGEETIEGYMKELLDDKAVVVVTAANFTRKLSRD